jgi:formylglycine-generating enzyme required for sulfatase activity
MTRQGFLNTVVVVFGLSGLLVFPSVQLAQGNSDWALAPRVRQSSPGQDAGPRQAGSGETSGPSSGESWTIPNMGLSFVYVEPGSFQMGSNDEDNEKPVHTVTISQGFWMGCTEVTNGLYQSFLRETNYDGSKEADRDYLRHHRDWSVYASTEATYPIVAVSWRNALALCAWLTDVEQKAGRLPSDYEYRLPTEAQWEYAARGGHKSRGYTFSGSNNIDEVAWHAINSGDHTHPVGQKESNELGLFDMSGNVWEWCLDRYGEYPSGPVTNPAGPATGSNRVFRGGSWIYLASYCRMAFRHNNTPTLVSTNIGFRVVLAPSVQGQ